MQRLVVHKFDALEEFPDIKAYSEFKYGSIEYTIQLAKELAQKLAVYIFFMMKDEDVYISGAPFNKVPVASTALAEYTAAYLSCMKNQGGGLVIPANKIKLFKINRQHSYHDDYGSMSKELRDKSISGETFYTDPDFLKDKNVIFIDDILITGAHERRVQAMVDTLGIKAKSLTYAYYAMLMDTGCCPTIESDLNHGSVASDGSTFVDFLLRNKGELLLNTRATKFILSLDSYTFFDVISRMTHKTVAELYKYAHNNDYANHPKYKDNFSTLCKFKWLI